MYLADDLATNGQVAIKELKVQSPEHLVRLRREVRLLRNEVNNRHVVDVLDADLDSTPAFVVMEFCEAGSLRSFVGGTNEWAFVGMVLAHVVQGLHGLHRAGGFHRDIKPDNLLVKKDAGSGETLIKVADFGLARVPDTSTGMTRTACGTQEYLAPEILAQRQFDWRADIYALGIVAVELLVGSRDPASLGRLHNLPVGARSLIEEMTHLDPARRPTTTAVAAKVHALLHPIPPTPPPPRPAQRGSNAGKIIVSLLAAGGVLAALSALAGGEGTSWDKQVGRYRGPDGKFRSG